MRPRDPSRRKGELVRKTLLISILAVAFAAPANAQTTTGMGAMQYYVGTWSCVAAQTGQPTVNATATYVADSGVLRSWVVVPVQGQMKGPYALSSTTTYDAQNSRYVQTSLDNGASWDVSTAKPWTGTTEQWADLSTSGKPGRAEVVRTDSNTFTLSGYETPTSPAPNFKVTCKRSS
jgi:hypothetical protein